MGIDRRGVGAAIACAAVVSLFLVPPQRLAAALQPSREAAAPPLIDRELFFGDPDISGAQISPDAQFIAFLKPFKGTRNIWVKRTSEPFSAAWPITADTKRPIRQYLWSRDGKYILFPQDQGGDENFNVFAVRPGDAPPAGSDVPAARNLTDVKGIRAQIFAVPKHDPDSLYVGLNDRDKAWHDLYKVRISTGERTLVQKNTERIANWTFDLNGTLRLASRAAEDGDTEILRVDADAFTKVYSCNVFEACAPFRFHKDGKRVYLATNKGVGDNLIHLTLLDVASQKEQFVEKDPSDRVDLEDVIFSHASDDLVATIYIDDKPRFAWKDKAFENDYRWLTSKLPGRSVALASRSDDERVWLVNAYADVDPGTVYLFDRAAKTLTEQYKVRDRLNRDWLAAMTPIRYKSSDGLEIPAYLTLPKGAAPTALPLIVLPHGGPWARDTWAYNGLTQFLANRGYAVLQPNFRGSTGYGKKFLDAGNKQWGDLMQDDLTWGVKELVARGTADPKRIGILGGSYGGYAALAGVAFTPDLYAAAVSIVGPSNLITLLNAIPPYWEAGRKMFMERMGNLERPEGKKQLERQSPLNSAAKIKTPLMVMQGANDPRVNRAESEQIVAALNDRGFPVEYLLAPDEGHGFARPVNNMAGFAAAEKFLAQHLGGRYQDNMPRDVAERLRVLTVDPKTVKRTNTITMAPPPKPIGSLRAGTTSYRATLQMNGSTINLSSTSDVKEQDDSWLVTETMRTPIGDVTDTAVLDKTSLVLRKRTLLQGPATMEYEVKNGKAAGEMTLMGAQSHPIATDVYGDLYADGPGAALAIALLPLADGYTTSFRNFDPQTQKVRTMQLVVGGTESITVPAGTFDAFKVDITSSAGPTVTEWVAKDSKTVLKVVATLPNLNGAVLTKELKATDGRD